jgi:hypothetical protein
MLSGFMDNVVQSNIQNDITASEPTNTYKEWTVSSKNGGQHETIQKIIVKVDDPSRRRHAAFLAILPDPLSKMFIVVVKPGENNTLLDAVNIATEWVWVQVGAGDAAIREYHVLELVRGDLGEYKSLK